MNLKKFYWRDDLPPVHFRPGTSDETIIQSILVNQQEYLFPQLPNVKSCFDIGANIGVTALVLHHVYPQARIHCFEPDKESFEILRKNTEHIEKIVLNNVALGNSNRIDKFYVSDDKTNFGGRSNHIPSQAASTMTVPVVDVAQYVAKVGCPEVIKIDCEGAEHEILTAIGKLDKVVWIAGEMHNIKEFELLAHIAQTHDLQINRPFGSTNWPFHAVNKAGIL